ncbi:unnamed protein product, partial [Symbiodinium sp. KB8]
MADERSPTGSAHEDSPEPGAGSEDNPEVRYEEGKGLQAYLDLITAQLKHLPRAPAPPAGAPEFTSSDWFYHLSWQQPELTGGLALATFTALFAVGVQEVSWLQLVLYALAGVVAFGGLLSIANAL